MKLICIGLSHHTADVQTREQFVGSSVAESALRACGCAEALLLTTCNRVEVYGSAGRPVKTAEVVRCLTRKIDIKCDASRFYRYEDADCAQHLFRVASGLDSMVVGETEILGQAKNAYESARASGSAGPYLHRLFQRAFRVAKQVRTHTEITRGAVSVASVAVDLAGKIFGDLRSCQVLVLGAGETSERTARALTSRGSTDVRVSNRSLDRAEELAHAVGGRAVPFEEWPEQCREVDILMTSTSSEGPLVTREVLAPIVRERPDRPLFIIDIAVPRNVDPAVNELGGVYLYDIDSLRSVAEQSLARRRQQIAAAEEIIAEHVAEFGAQIARGLNWQLRTADHPSVRDGSLRTSEL
ncbi:MAG TPA: glutamyl-tRNA reductase [Chthoniobacterales bacterium]|nr:glutamyl-tRNA reductase [Chthoniobacterales bacterium]